MKRRIGNEGITLLEMMVVVAIIGLAAAFAVPSYLKMLPHIRVKAAAGAVASTLQLARMTAIAQNKATTVSFDGVKSYEFDAGHRAQNEDWFGKVDLYFPTSIFGMHNRPGFYNGKVTFDPYGRSTGLHDKAVDEAVYLKSTTPANEYYRVSVSYTSGRVVVEHWNVDKWVE